MKAWLRFSLCVAFALVGAAVARAQSLSPTGISASPGSGLPGDSITYSIAVNNGAATQFGPGATANFTVLFTHLLTGSTYTVGPVSVAPTSGFIAAAVVNPATGAVTPGSGTFTITASLPTKTLEAGNYSARVTLNSVTAGSVGTPTFTVSSSVITVSGKPDLQITALTYAAGTSYVGGTVIPMTLTYVNNQSTNGTQNVPYTPGINGFPTFVRIQVVLSTNPTFGDADDFQLTINDISAGNFGSNQTVDSAGNSSLPADWTGVAGTTHTFSWNQILPGNFSGSYYVLAKIDSLNALPQNDPAALTVNGNNVWIGNAINPTGTLINLLPSNFPTVYTASHGNGVTTTASGYSDNPSISSDGRYVAFASDAANLVANDTNAARDIFIFDSQTSLVRRLSVSQQGAQANAASNNPAISANGRYVAFASNANNLVIGDTNGFSDIFVVDTLTGLIVRVSGANAAGGQANNPSFRPAMSSTGRYVVFESTATNLTATATAVGVSHVYLYDRDVNASGTFDTIGNTATRLIDSDVTTPLTVAGNASAIQATISSDGTWVAFASKATNLVSPATTAGRQHVYVRPTANVGTATSGIKNVDVVNTTAAEGNADGQTPSLSSDGHYVAYASLASNLVAGDTNTVSDIFVYDNTAPVGTPIVRRMSVPDPSTGFTEGTDPSTAGFQLGSINPTISADGRYVAFASLDSNLTSGDRNGQFQATDSNLALDIFVHDRDSTASGTLDTVAAKTQMVSVNPFGYQTNGLLSVPSTAASNIYPVLSANGRFVAFPSDAENNAGLAFGATNLLPLDSNGLRDVFLFDRRTNATVTPATPPTVTITNPGNGSTALVNTPISVTASATTTVGVVASVQFFVNGTSLGTSTLFPYSQTWTPTAVGSYTLSALVTDSFGNLGVSTNVTVTIRAAPSVGITTPIGGSSIIVGTVTTVGATAAASNPGAFINTVQFFANGTSLGTVTAPPSSVSFTPTVSWTPAATGNVTLTAIAIDSIGTQTTSPNVAVTIIAAGGGGGGGGGASPPPTVSLSPAPPAGIAVNTPVVLTATATAAAGFTLTNVQYFANGVSIGSASAFPYKITWTPTAIGTYSITAVATDNVATAATSAAASVVVSTGTAPTISLVSPNTGATYAVGSPIALSAATTLGAGLIASVDFFANNVAIGSKTAGAGGQGSVPFFNLEWTPAAAGTYVFTAVVTDTSGNRTVSTSVTITVASVAAPVVTVTSPTSGATLTVNKTLTVTAAATAGTGASIAQVAFFANGASLGASTKFPFSASWTPTAPGAYVLRAVATDSFGTQTSSSTVSVTVSPGSTGLPFVYLTSVPTGTNVTANTLVFVAANAGEPGGTVTSVEFYANGALIGSKSTAPYFVQWTPTAATTYTITAIVTDAAGNRVTSTASTLTALVQVGVVPVASFSFSDPSVSAPTGGGTPPANPPFTPVKVDYGSSLVLTASAVAQGGSIASVQFFANGTSVATVSAAPYTTTYTLNTLSDVVLTAIVTDSSGNAIHATPLLINTQPSTSAALATVSLVSPLDGASYVAGGQILFNATANFGLAAPPKVDFYVNGAFLTTVASPSGAGAFAPYQFAGSLTRTGTYTVQAVARSGTTATVSATSRITITSSTAPTVSIRTPASGGSYVVGTSQTISADAAASNGTIQSVQFFVNGVALSTATVAPFNAAWNPGSPGIYTLTAAATDAAGNQTLSAPVTVTYTGNQPPSVSLSTPSAGARVVAGSAVSLVAAASDADGTVASVRFIANGTVIGTASSTAPFTATWTPTAAGVYSVVAQATDNSGNVTTSSAVAVNVLVNQPPVVSLTTPANGTLLRVGASADLVATASDPDGTVVSVEFFANGQSLGKGKPSTSGLSFSIPAGFTPTAAGTFSIIAQAIDNTGNVTQSTAMNVTVLPNQPPTVSFTSPNNGAVVRAGSVTTLNANASDADGTVTSVQFSVLSNGVSVATLNATLGANGYSAPWTPAVAGIYVITATATDNSGATTSTTATVLAVSAASGGGDTVYTGGFFGIGETGRFAVISINGKTAAFIGYSTVGAGKVYFYPSIPVDASRGFTLTDATGRVLVSGKTDDTAATITTLDGASVTLIGIVSFPAGVSVATGYYTGSLSGRPSSQLAAIVGPDGTIMLAAIDGSVRTAGAGVVDSTGAFRNIPALGGGLFNGKADPLTNFLSGNLTGALAGGMMAAVESGVSFSDGFLRNLSSRGQVGPGSNVLVAGFVVGGTTSKQVLIRAIGPSLAQFGITGALADPQLILFGGVGGQAQLASNDNWGGAAALFNASTSVGAFPLAPTSLDSVLLATLAPGNYTAQVNGVNGGTGTALVELYDVDNPTPYSPQKVINISTRAVVGTGQNRLIAGFVVNGSTAKKVLVRAVGPTLGAAPFNVPGVLADPVLRIIRNTDNLVIRENDNWETGNDISLVSDAAVKSGAFPLVSGSKDAAILISLPPGTYSAEVTGSGSTTGIALVEVYEVP